MSLTGLKYDPCEEKKYLTESIGPGLYQINTPVLCSTCFQENPQIINQRGGVSMSGNVDWRFYAGPIDIETDLRNINRPATRCPEGKYEPKCPRCNVVTSGQPCGDGVSISCHKCGFIFKGTTYQDGKRCTNEDLINFPDCNFPVENTRLCNPPSTLRGTGWNRFETLCLNPQAQLFFPGAYLIPTRTVFRDNHRPCIRQTKVNSIHPVDVGTYYKGDYKMASVCGTDGSFYTTKICN